MAARMSSARVPVIGLARLKVHDSVVDQVIDADGPVFGVRIRRMAPDSSSSN